MEFFVLKDAKCICVVGDLGSVEAFLFSFIGSDLLGCLCMNNKNLLHRAV